MDLSKLESMSSEALQAIRDKCIDVLGKRKGNSLRRGAVGWFLDRQNAKRYIYVERINQKTVSGYEVDPITRARISLTSWRVSPNLLNMVGDVAPPKPVAAHRPSTAAAAVW
jgi:hypothetical protein